MPQASVEDRGIAACSDAERRRADVLAQQLREAGREVRVVPLWVRPLWWLVLALCCAAGVTASALAVDRELLGLGIAGGALIVALVDLATGALSRRIGPARATQAVVATPPTRSGAREVTVLLTASTDDPRTGLAAGLRVRLVPAALAALALLTLLLGVRAIGADGLWLDVVQLLPTLALLASIALLFDAGRAPAAPRETAPHGREDAPSGDGEAPSRIAARGAEATHALIAAAAALDASPPPHVDVAVVLAGAGDAHAAGLSAWLRARRRRGLDPASVAIVHVQAGDTPGTWRERDGVVLRLKPHPQLLAAARAAGDGDGPSSATTGRALAAEDAALAPAADDAEPARSRSDVSAAGVVGPRGWPAIAIGPDADFAERLVRELSAALGEPRG